MGGFWQGAALALIGAVLSMVLGKRSEHMGIMVTMAVVCMIAIMALNYIKPAIELIARLQVMGNLDQDMLSTLLKAVGIAMVTELATMVCADAGMTSAGKALQMLGAAVVLWLSIPLVERMLDLLQDVLGGS
jgi:stage III sporulation protein AD